MAITDTSARADLLLVGRRLPDNENLGIGYLLAAARRAGLRADMVQLNGWDELGAVASRILSEAPPLLGLAFPDGSSAVLPLTLGQLLRDAGYRGHITGGGPFATLARQWLLERHGWLDSVVRYAGEAPLVALARALAARQPVSEVAGVTTRRGDGLPAPVLDPTQLEVLPARDALPRLLGHGMAQIAASRGCPGRCAYCGPASLQLGEVSEGRAAGYDHAELRAAGVGGVRRRPLDDLCDEMASLWHERDVRYFYFVDEHLLPRRERDALRWLDRWRRGLARRGVGRLGVGCMLRADLLTPAMIEGFVEAGLVRTFLGIELASEAEAKRFTRGGRMDRALASMRALDRRGVAVSCNLMLVHPDATVASIAAAIALTRSFGSVSFEPAQMHVYHGTALHQRIAAEGRLLGNPLQYAYTFRQPAVERFADLLNRLRLDAFGDYSLTCRMHDAAVAVSLGERLYPDTRTRDLRTRFEQLSLGSNELRTGVCEQALGLAQAGFGEEQASHLVEQARSGAAAIGRDIDHLDDDVLDRFERPRARFTPLRAAAVPLVSVCLASAAVTGCHPSAPDAVGQDVAVVPVVVGTETSAQPTGVQPAVSSEQGPVPTPPPCARERAAELEAEVRRIISRIEPCKYASVDFSARLNVSGRYSGVEIAGAIERELSNEDLTCLAEHGAAVESPGKELENQKRMRDAIEVCRTQGGRYVYDRVRIEVGAGGKVTSVDSEPPGKLPWALRSCIVKVLRGLRFPCYANTTQRPWPRQMVIME